MVLPLYFLALVAFNALAAPAGSSQSQTLSNSMQNFTSTTSSPFTDAHSTNLPITSTQPLSSPSTSSSQSSFIPTTTGALLVTEVATVFETTTIYATPSSTTVVTVIVTTTTTPTTPTQGASWSNRTVWVAPQQISDLSTFNVTYFPTGQKNLDIVSKIPLSAKSPTSKSKIAQSPLDSQNGTNQSSILQLVYPAHSVNPGSKPAGGADFYASPLNLAGARNVTFGYSVFFPADFDWVKGGKLPGLYGGHTGCSGGSSAHDCFSTRLMWRPQGVGELYLYAPKDKQSDAMCSDPQSVCDSAYGFSIGRGSFNFTAGDWTNLKQNVVLNTPGKRDGTFVLFVNGEPVINRTDVLYRDAPPSTKLESSPKMARVPSTSPFLSSTSQSPSSGAQEPLLGLLGLRRQTEPPIPKTIGANELETTRSRPTRRASPVLRDDDAGSQQPAEFIGIFFSTFFGGHGSKYATPKRQYTWFKDFAITRHD